MIEHDHCLHSSVVLVLNSVPVLLRSSPQATSADHGYTFFAYLILVHSRMHQSQLPLFQCHLVIPCADMAKIESVIWNYWPPFRLYIISWIPIGSSSNHAVEIITWDVCLRVYLNPVYTNTFLFWEGTVVHLTWGQFSLLSIFTVKLHSVVLELQSESYRPT